MANGPRNLNMLHQLNKKINLELNCSINIKNIYDDSLSCVYGEKFSSKGKLNNCSNGIYIGGGTGIADGIVYQNQIVDITAEKDFKKSWEIIADDGKSVEECLSLGGLSQKWNSKKMKSVESLNDLFLKAKMKNKKAEKILFSAGKAFNILINSRISFFKSKTNYPEKIVIGQRLGVLLNEKKSSIKKYHSKKIILRTSLLNYLQIGIPQLWELFIWPLMKIIMHKEPIMSIGLVMPEDNQKDISLVLNGDSFDLRVNDLNQTHF